MRELEDKIRELYEQGICPPYTLVVKDGGGLEVHLSVTAQPPLLQEGHFCEIDVTFLPSNGQNLESRV